MCAMVQVFTDAGSEQAAGRYRADLESALLSAALAQAANPAERQRLYANWLLGTFNATAFGLEGMGEGAGLLQWLPEGEGHRLIWLGPTGFACPLARVYAQPDGTWAALVVAGVRGELLEAMGAAEWAVSRLAG